METNNSFPLGCLFPTLNDLMNHLSKFGTLSDDEIIKSHMSPYGGIDVEVVLTTMCERDICKSAIDRIINKLIL